MNTQGVHLYFIYEIEHVPELEARLARGETLEIIGLDYEVELEMKKRNIHFISLSDISVSPDGDRDLLEYMRDLTFRWYTSPETAFFQHDGILLGEQHEGVILYYLEALVYYLAVLEQVFAHFSNATRVFIPQTFHHISGTADPVAFFRERLPEDVTKLLAKRRGIACESILTPTYYHAKNIWHKVKTYALQFIFRGLVRISNTLVTLFQKPRPIRIFASDPWSRLEPFIKNMPDVELIMTRRKEMREMGWRNIWRTRARFHHRLDFVDANMLALAKENAQKIAHAWDALGEHPAFSESFAYKGISYWPIAKEMLDSLVKNHTEDAIVTIENTKELLGRYDINCVLLFASTKGYNNIIANVAERMNIPSIELQHALSSTEASFLHTRLHTRYLAAYGPFTRRVYERAGVEPWRIFECGSPRFDRYARPLDAGATEALRQKLRLDGKHLNTLVNVPQIYLSLEFGNYTSYEVEHVLEDYAELQKKIPILRFLLRPKPGFWRRSFYVRKELLDMFEGETRYVQDENLHTLLALSDMVISGNSALVLEALMMRKPVIMFLPKKLDHDFQEFEDAGAVLVARTREKLIYHAAHLKDKVNREALVKRADGFLHDNFITSGTSSERVTAMIREVTKKESV